MCAKYIVCILVCVFEETSNSNRTVGVPPRFEPRTTKTQVRKKKVLSLSLSMRESVSRLYVADINLNLLPASEC